MAVFLSTLNQMAVLAIFILAGFVCQRIKLLPETTATVLSRLETYLIMPAYILNTFIANCTLEYSALYGIITPLEKPDVPEV